MSTKKSKNKLPLEKVTQQKVAQFFKHQGYVVETEKKVPTGRVDILIKEYKPNGELVHHIVETKRENSSYHIKAACAQLAVYKNHYGKNTQLYIVTSDKSPLSAQAKAVLLAYPDIIYKVI